MQSILFDEMSGHDSQVESVITDPIAKTVTISLRSYETYQSPERIPVKILFSNVTSVSTIMDMKVLAINRGAGNVVQWHIAKKAGTSFITLTGGYLAITARDTPTLIDGSK